MSQPPFIDQQRVHYLVQLPCQVLYVIPSRYYAWCQRTETTGAPAWETAMVDVFDDHQRRYDTRRLQVELRELGYWVGQQALRTALRRHARRALQTEAFRGSRYNRILLANSFWGKSAIFRGILTASSDALAPPTHPQQWPQNEFAISILLEEEPLACQHLVEGRAMH